MGVVSLYDIIVILVSLAVLLMYSVLHEVLHYVVARVLGYEAKIINRPGMFTLVTSVDMPRFSYKNIAVLLAPLLLAPAIYYTIMFIIGVMYPGYTVYEGSRAFADGVQYYYLNIYGYVRDTALGTVYAYLFACSIDVLYAVAALLRSERLYNIASSIVKRLSFTRNMYLVVKRAKYDYMVIDFGRNKESLESRYADKLGSGEYMVVRAGDINV